MSHLKTCLGVDLGQHTVKIVEIALEKDGARVVRAGQGATAVTPGMSEDDRRQAIVAATREVLKKNKFSTRKAVFGISGLRVFVRRFRLPVTSEERLARMIQFEARQQIPFPVDQTFLQYQYREIAGEPDVEVLLSAVRHDDIREYMQIIAKTGLTPVAVGVSSIALYNAHRFCDLTREDAAAVFTQFARKAKKGPKKGAAAAEADKPIVPKGPAAADADAQTLVINRQDLMPPPETDQFAFEEVKGLVNLGATSYDIAVGRMGKDNANILFMRTVALGGDHMTKAIMKSLQVENFFDAERLKTSATQLMAFDFDFESEGEINQEASMAATEVADAFVREIRRSLDYFLTQPDGMAIDTVALTGGQAQIPKAESYLEEKLTVPVILITAPPENSALKWSDASGTMTPYMIATGLGLQGVGLGTVNVDFLPEDRKIIRDFPYRITAVMVALLLGIVAIASNAGGNYASQYRSNSESVQSEILRKQLDVQAFEQAQALHDETGELYVKLSKTFGQREYWMSFLARLAELKPPQVVLEDVHLTHDGTVRITGLSEVQVAAAYFQDSLKETFGEEFSEAPKIESVMAVGRPVEGLGPDPSRFVVSFKLKTKRNHLKVTPTPAPAAAGAAPVGRPAGPRGRGN